MTLRLTLLFALFLCLAAQGEKPPAAPKSAELYSWRTADGKVLYGLQVGDVPQTPELLIEDKKYHLSTQEDLGKALVKLGVGATVSWHHRNQKGRATFPPEEVEVETKETALKAGVNLSIQNGEDLEPEYWNQPRGRYEDALKKLSSATKTEQKSDALRKAAREAFALGLYPEAKKLAQELEVLAPRLKEEENWTYGDAVQDFNLVLGRVAVAEGDINTARGCLLGAGYSPGSPRMNSLGPDMSLANDLLAKGERKLVLQYLDLCRNFWKTDHGLIDQWIVKIKHGEIPDFGTNLRD